MHSSARFLFAFTFVALTVSSGWSEDADDDNAASPAERNKGLVPFGSQENEQRLVRLIKDTIAPPKPVKRLSAEEQAVLVPQSKPVGGLTARIEHVGQGSYVGIAVLVRLTNVSQQPLRVPTGNPSDRNAPRLFELYAQRRDGKWQCRPWFPGEPADGPQRKATDKKEEYQKVDENVSVLYGADMTGNRVDRPAVVLKPGESCLAYLAGADDRDEEGDKSQQDTSLKVILRQGKAAQGNDWQGVLETPPHPAYPSPARTARLAGTLPMPEHFPAFSDVPFMGGNMSGLESHVERVGISNWELTQALGLYESAGVRRELENRMAQEKNPHLKLLVAAIAAAEGSEPAALVILEAMKQTEYATVLDAHSALLTAMFWREAPPEWTAELAMSALADARYVTRSGKSDSDSDTPSTIAYLADEDSRLAGALGQTKCRAAVPFLIELTKKSGGDRGPIMALGDIGDPRAIPVLLECLEAASKKVKYKEGWGLDDKFIRPLEALQALKAKEAVPLLLKLVEFPEVIEALERIGDRRALPVARELVASKGKIVRKGEPVYPSLEKQRFFSASLLLASLEEGDAVPRLGAMLQDQTWDEFDRRSVVWRFGDRKDPRAIPFLVQAAKTDPSGAVVNQAITVLGLYKTQEAVEGLIDCFDTDFQDKQDWKRAYKPGMFRENIAECLREITGQSFGPNKEQWSAWWNGGGKNAPLK